MKRYYLCCDTPNSKTPIKTITETNTKYMKKLSESAHISWSYGINENLSMTLEEAEKFKKKVIKYKHKSSYDFIINGKFYIISEDKLKRKLERKS